jgi:hypothetical protein
MLLVGAIRLLEVMPISEQKVEHLFVAPALCPAEC